MAVFSRTFCQLPSLWARAVVINEPAEMPRLWGEIHLAHTHACSLKLPQGYAPQHKALGGPNDAAWASFDFHPSLVCSVLHSIGKDGSCVQSWIINRSLSLFIHIYIFIFFSLFFFLCVTAPWPQCDSFGCIHNLLTCFRSSLGKYLIFFCRLILAIKQCFSNSGTRRCDARRGAR